MPTTKSNGILLCISVNLVANARPDFQGPRFGSRPCDASFETAADSSSWMNRVRKTISKRRLMRPSLGSGVKLVSMLSLELALFAFAMGGCGGS
eukprot:1371062-Amphidinium_carterae.2